jgi:para-nitrobenzyl esterase
VILLILLPMIIAAHKGPKTGEFVGGAPVAGLTYQSGKQTGTTDAQGRFVYCQDKAITFSIGDLVLGTANGQDRLSPIDLVPDAADGTHATVNNLSVLLQSLDQDGHLNNGIRITREMADIVGGYAINFNQTTTAFAADPVVKELLAEIETAGLFTDTDPRARTLQGATAAQEQLARCLSERRVVKTRQGALKGYAANDATWQYLGIPYAKPPLGDLRWRPSQPPAPWKGVREAIAWGDQAAQTPSFQVYGEGGMSEDCLYLNVTAPKKARKLPVMVWFHGGAFTILTGNTKGYNNVNALTTQDVVLVTVCHRLGPFGYLAHPLLVEDSQYGGSGNYGQMDLVAALKWVRHNIAAFGGDPGNVTIFGQSGGGGKVGSLMASPMAAGLFHKAVIMAGTSPLAPDATVESVIADAEAVGNSLFTRLGITSIEQARALPWTTIVQSDIDAGIPREVYRPTVDFHYMSDTFYNSIVNGQPGDVPLLIGATAADYPSIIAGLKQHMPLRSDYSQANLYVYKYNRVPTGWTAMGLLSNHGGEIPYLFNFPATFVNNYLFNLVLDPVTGKRPVIGDLNGNGVTGTAGDTADIYASMAWSADDDAMAQTTMTIWSNFAKTGDPSIPGLTWPAYTTENDTYVEIGSNALTVKTGLDTAFP